jgi:hypothetical protein
MEDIDLDLEQGDRVSRRIAHGVYRILHNRKIVGEELWGVFGLRAGGYRLMTEIDLKWPVANQQRARLDVDTEWRTQSLWAQIDLQGKRRVAHYTPAANGVEVSVMEGSLRYADAGRNAEQPFQLAPAAKPKPVLNTMLPANDDIFLDFGSTLLNFAHLKRIKLLPGKSVDIQTIVLMQPALEPLSLVQVYTYQRDEQITSLIEPYVNTRRVTIEERDGLSEAGAPVTTLWVDEHGVAVKQDVLLGRDTHGCELTSYTWQGDF